MGKNLKLNPSLPFLFVARRGSLFSIGIHGVKMPSDIYFKAFVRI